MKKKNIIILTIVSLVVIATSSTLAWFFTNKETNGDLNPGSLSKALTIDTYFNVDNTKVDASSYKNNNLLVCNGSDYIKNDISDSNYILNNKENNIKNLVIDLELKPQISMCVRVKILSNVVLQKYYYNTKTYRNTSLKEDINNTLFTISDDNWYFDSETRFYYYRSIIKKNDNQTINFVSGGKQFEVNTKSISYYENYIYNIGIEAEVVQANRYQEVWNITDDFLN